MAQNLIMKTKKTKKTKTEEVTIERDFTKKFHLLKFNDNWADEMDVDGFVIYDEDEYKAWLDKIPDHKFSYGIGTNEEIEYSSKAVFLNSVATTNLTPEEVQFFFKFFGHPSTKCIGWDSKAGEFKRIERSTAAGYGFFPDFDWIDEDLDGDDDEDYKERANR